MLFKCRVFSCKAICFFVIYGMKFLSLFLVLLFNLSFTFVETQTPPPKISTYPNPAVDYFNVTNHKDLKSIVLYNLVGHPVKSFEYFENESFFIDDLPDGVYLIQFQTSNQSIIQTNRLTKKCP